ncbi:MAG: 16S rRNA (guanine(966)-N(2))-methyltransferase RsmD [Syntrophobacteraceae bacterium]|nr:16S rRNA (guanine(966)-N(2))-methyltransferase RsmD [Syntrophobacteraceae bacterium]
MRIISGDFRGRRLHAPGSDRIRPTIDRVREAVFSMIAEYVPDARVLDLFAGTGAVGLEALSRGARFCSFVDNGAEALRLIRENVALCGAQESARVINATVASALRRLEAEKELFDLVFLDPPYGKGYVEQTLDMIGPVAGESALVIAESHVKDLRQPISDLSWQKERERRYGDTLISIYSRPEISG